jgi:hypothetical protein
LIRSTVLAIAIVAGVAANPITANASQSISKEWLQAQKLKKEREQREAARQRELETELQLQRERNRELETNLERQRALQRQREQNRLIRQQRAAEVQREQNNIMRQRASVARELNAQCDAGEERACIRLGRGGMRAAAPNSMGTRATTAENIGEEPPAPKPPRRSRYEALFEALKPLLAE